MRTERAQLPTRAALAALLAGLAAVAQGWQADWDLDTEMAVLDEPVRRPIILPYGDGRQRGGPDDSRGWSYYRQQPPGAQGDFRNLPPSGEGEPAGGGAPGAPGSDSSPGGGTAPGSGSGPAGGGGDNNVGDGGNNGNNAPNQPPGPQLPPPEIEGPEIPTDPLPPINPPPIDLI